MVVKRLKLHQFFDYVARKFSCTQACKITPFLKNGLVLVLVVLHHLATPFDNTNAVSKPELTDHIIYGVFCGVYGYYRSRVSIIMN